MRNPFSGPRESSRGEDTVRLPNAPNAFEARNKIN